MAGFKLPAYPDSIEVTLGARELLDPLFKGLLPEVSEFTFANIFLFRNTHSYRLSTYQGVALISGRDRGESFFMLPFGLPAPGEVARLFDAFSFMKNATMEQARALGLLGYKAAPDRANFDYVYLREELAGLKGRRLHKKKNLVNAFFSDYTHEERPLTSETLKDAAAVLDKWRGTSPVEGDYGAAAEALSLMEELMLCGTVYYVDDAPAAYAMGEELRPDTFVVHFEKGIDGVKGLFQFVNYSFASKLPERYVYVNREQDLGDEGLRHAKESYKPGGFVKKFRVTR